MNTKFVTARCRFLIFLMAAAGCAWVDSEAAAQIQSGAATTSVSTPSNTGYACVQRNPDSKIWQRAVLQTNQSGSVQTNIQSYIEAATGLCYLQNGQYVDSVEEVDAVAGGAQAVQGRHQVQWSANANTPGGAVILTTPDSKTLSSTVYGLAYYDVASGSNSIVAGLQDCIGSIVAPNQVVYAGAFSNLNADVQYTYTKAGLSQDIVLHQAPPAPDQYGLSDETTELQVYTEFFNSPQPEMTAVTNDNVTDDQVLDFGEMKMGIGQALFFGGQDTPVPAGIVTKQWVQVDGRTFLIESIPYAAISNQLQQLPQAKNLKVRRGSVRRTAFLESSPTRPSVPAKAATPMKMATLETAGLQLMIDYDILSSTNNLTLQGDTTYYVSGTVNVTGTLTIEGGTVVKYSTTNNPNITAANFVCETAPYRKGVFSSMNDNSVGSVISGSTGSPGIDGDTMCLNFGAIGGTNSLVFSNLRFSHSTFGIFGEVSSIGSDSLEISDCQFVNCFSPVFLSTFYSGTNTTGFPVNLYNVLISGCSDGLDSSDSGSTYVRYGAVNVTADQVGTLVSGSTNNVFHATNSLFTSVTNMSGTFTNCYTNASSSSGVYQTVGAGSYYLAEGSTNRGMGTTNIDSTLLTNLQTKTTYPPVIMPYGYFTNDYTFFPQAQRDNSGSTVDLGYHYDPLDYVIDIDVSNATATVLPGTALATAGPYNYGVWLDTPPAIFNCQGTATNPNYIVRYNTVQEQSNTNWETTNWQGSVFVDSGDSSSLVSANFRFTDWSALAGDNHFNVGSPTGNTVPFTFQDCQFYNGAVDDSGITLCSTNCLFQRVNMMLWDYYLVGSNTFCNNLFWQGELDLTHYSGDGTWTFRDNLFNRTWITNEPYSIIDITLSNAYVTTNSGVLLPTNYYALLTNSPAFQAGTLGSYYYPITQTSLINAGSQLASAAGLYHYTVTTNNTIEGTNTVSIGFHYVACSNGIPISTPGDGIPDYIADANGNGIVDPGETSWTNYVSSNGLTSTTGLVVFTPLQ